MLIATFYFQHPDTDESDDALEAHLYQRDGKYALAQGEVVIQTWDTEPSITCVRNALERFEMNV